MKIIVTRQKVLFCLSANEKHPFPPVTPLLNELFICPLFAFYDHSKSAILNGSLRNIITRCQWQVVISLHLKPKKSFSGSIIPFLHIKGFLLFHPCSGKKERSFLIILTLLTFLFFLLFSVVTHREREQKEGGHSRVATAAKLLRVKGRQTAERAWVCPLQHRCTNRLGGKKGRKREGVKEEMGGKRSGLILGGFKILEGEL